MQLSRNFRALKIWMSLREHGVEKYGRLISQNAQQARYLAALVESTPGLELVAPVDLNIVCFRFNPGDREEDALNALNQEILLRLHESGVAAPSYTTLRGRYAIRAAITNHRSEPLKGTLKLRLPQGWSANADDQAVAVPAGEFDRRLRKLKNVAGGITAWAERIEPTFPRH